MTPSQSLLFRFSALTFNAHLIHLDREYARDVEGYRNLLVHGPLSLVLLLHAVSANVKARSKGQEVIQDIQYRNIAPLHCDEEMRICGRLKHSTKNGSLYDIWIEGPSGGVAVKGTVHTTVKKKPSQLAAQEKTHLISDKITEQNSVDTEQTKVPSIHDENLDALRVERPDLGGKSWKIAVRTCRYEMRSIP